MRDVGAEGVVLDLLDRNAARAAVTAAQPEAIIHQATALSALTARSMRKFDQAFAMTNQLRIAGTDNLLAAARVAGTARFVAQSFAPLIYARTGTSLKTEADALDQHPAGNARETMDAMHHLETAVLSADVDPTLSCCATAASMGRGQPWVPAATQIEAVRKRQFPIVGDGGGVLSFIHVEDAARAAVALHCLPGVYNIVDDDPAPSRDVAMYIATAGRGETA